MAACLSRVGNRSRMMVVEQDKKNKEKEQKTIFYQKVRS